MLRYNTSNDRVCRVIRDWCRENNYYYSFEPSDRDHDFCIYPFRILAPSYAEDGLLERIRSMETRKRRMG